MSGVDDVIGEQRVPLVADHGRRSTLRGLRELAQDFAVAVIFCFFVITYVAQAFRVQGTSMLPLLADNERIIVNKFIYRVSPIERGDVVVFYFPSDPSVSFIKRVAARPGDTVELRSGALYVNGRAVREDYVANAYRDTGSFGPLTVPAGYYYVLGDHRNSSNDSRSWGEVPERYIYGKAFARFWPLSKLGAIR